MQHKRFKSAFAENIFKQKYANGIEDTWDSLCERLVEDVCGTRWGTDRALMSEGDREQLVEYMKEMKFVPGGRYLYYAGRPYKAFNNCMSSDTRFITESGVKSFSEFSDGDKVKVLSPKSGNFEDATVRAFGQQQLYEITFQNVRGSSKKEWKVKATRNHRWILKSGETTEYINVGDVVPATTIHAVDTKDEDFRNGLRHGMVFADGNVHVKKSGFGHQLRLCGNKSIHADIFTEVGTITYPPFANGDPVIYIKSEFNLKELPTTTNINYLRGFLIGWITLDGHSSVVNQLHSIDKVAMEFFIDNCWMVGAVVTGELLFDDTPTNFGERNHPLYRVNFRHTTQFSGFKVTDITPLDVEEVWCVVEPKYHQFTLEYGMSTGNCYLLRAEEDTREEWSEIVWRAMRCLMTGGGIGIDYSRLRPSGKILSRTGGTASGPLPLMYAVNELGRNVMQGGSRRSAIYASLDFQHEDIPLFLRAKNWDSRLRNLKADDFNFPAPLDMTNISINYNDAALLNQPVNPGCAAQPAKFDPTNEVFLANVRQAMETGEPGFSFNFGKKQNETLRNACTEVTSEDDSDVCNLGSVNLGNIQTIEEFRDIVTLASKFLVCGTLRADLPYDKVYKVREKNRRLGLGLMGIHEWLLQRGKPYEVTPELHKWLQVYKDESERSANDHCNRLFVSSPVAFRAIAPTGSLGILASTTTGIEPLFACAYKRRYLTDGTKWKYEYVIDATADRLIREFDIAPENIDTAYKLSHDYERRIKFQADIQDYVDMSISSTINLPQWGTKENNESRVSEFAATLARYAPRLRGFTCYPDGSRGGQPLTEVDYKEALHHKGVVFTENDICDISGKGGTCGA